MKVILIHGNGGSTADNHWFPIVAGQLRSAGLEVINCQFPETKIAYAHIWIPFLEELGADENTILIGHSSGAIAAMRYAETHALYGSVLVGSYHTHLGMNTEKASGYFDDVWHWDTIKKNQNWILQFASVDDPWIPIEEPRFIRDKLDTEYYEFEDQAHFDQERHKQAFPELLEALQKRLST